MKWITRERVKVDRVACPWLIRKFVDPEAEFLFVPREQVLEAAEREAAVPFDVDGVELGHHGGECSFEAILHKYGLDRDPVLTLLGKIVNGADTDNSLWRQPEGPGLQAIAEGFRHLGFQDDHEINGAEWIVYDALHAYIAAGWSRPACRKDSSRQPRAPRGLPCEGRRNPPQTAEARSVLRPEFQSSYRSPLRAISSSSGRTSAVAVSSARLAAFLALRTSS